MLRAFRFSILVLLFPAASLAQPADFEERVRSIAAELRCVVCQNLSVADSPSELAQQMREVVRQQLREGKSPEEIKAYFVSIDPERDTPETVTQYIQSNGFPEDIIGLSGTPEQLTEVSENFLAPFEKVEDEATASGYLVNHSAFLYLMDADWNLESFFTPSDTPESIAACLTALDR